MSRFARALLWLERPSTLRPNDLRPQGVHPSLSASHVSSRFIHQSSLFLLLLPLLSETCWLFWHAPRARPPRMRVECWTCSLSASLIEQGGRGPSMRSALSWRDPDGAASALAPGGRFVYRVLSRTRSYR